MAKLAGSSFSSQFLSFMHLACPPSITVCQPQSLAGAAGTSRFPAPARDPTFGLFLSPCRKDSRLLFVCFVLRRAGPPLPCAPCSALGASPCPAAEMFLPCKPLWAVLRWSSASLLLCACHFSLPDAYYFLLELAPLNLCYALAYESHLDSDRVGKIHLSFRGHP